MSDQTQCENADNYVTNPSAACTLTVIEAGLVVLLNLP